MNRKNWCFSALLLLGVSVPAMAATHTATPQSSAPKDHMVLVFVHVDDHGKITRMMPAERLQPGLKKLTRETLDQMITKPAHDKDGKPIPSQFIIKLALHSKTLSDGNYQSSLGYVSTKPVPPGIWHWYKNTFTGKLRLVSQIQAGSRDMAALSGQAKDQRSATRWKMHQNHEAAVHSSGR